MTASNSDRRARSDEELLHLEAVGRTRALTDAESLRVERLLRTVNLRAHRDLARRRARRAALTTPQQERT